MKCLIVLATLLNVVSVAAQDVVLSKSSIDFGLIAGCSFVRDSLTLINMSRFSIPAPTPAVRGGFRYYLDNHGVDIEPNETRTVYIEFLGDASRPVWTLNVLFTFFPRNSPLPNPQPLTVSPIVIRGSRSDDTCASIAIDNITARPGTTTVIAIQQVGTEENVAFEQDSVTFWMRWDSTCLVGPQIIPNALAQSVSTALIRVPLRLTDGPLFELPVTVVLGTDASTPLSIVSLSSSRRLGVRSGILTLEGICTDRRPRLFDPSAAVRTGPLLVHDMVGRFVIELADTSTSVVAGILQGQGLRGPFVVWDTAYSQATLVFVD
jgi:hypothetical protein